MSAFARAREAIAGAVSVAGVPCSAYAPDALMAPGAWIDSISIDYGTQASFCGSGEGEAVVIVVGQRHDQAGATEQMEGLVPAVIAALEDIDGVRVAQVQSGSTEISGQSMPAVLFTTQFNFTHS